MGRHSPRGWRAHRAVRRAARQRRTAEKTAEADALASWQHRVRHWRAQRAALLADGDDPAKAGPSPVYVPPTPGGSLPGPSGVVR